RPARRQVSEAILGDIAADSILWPAQQSYAGMTEGHLSAEQVARDPVISDSLLRDDRPLATSKMTAGLVVMGLALGLWSRGATVGDALRRRPKALFSGPENGRFGTGDRPESDFGTIRGA